MILRIFFCLISVFAGLSGCIAFYVLKNYQASLWGLLTGIFSTLLLHLHRLRANNTIIDYYTSSAVGSIKCFGYSGFAVGVSGFVYNTIILFYMHVPIIPIEGSSLIAMVWAAIAAKSGFLLFWYGREYELYVAYAPARSPLLPTQTTSNEITI